MRDRYDNEMKAKEIYNMMLEELAEASSETLLEINNDYCSDNGYYEDMIYSISEIDDLFEYLKPSEVLEKFGSIYDKEYFKEGYYTEADGADMVEDLIDDMEALLDYVIEKDNIYNVICDDYIEEYNKLIA